MSRPCSPGTAVVRMLAVIAVGVLVHAAQARGFACARAAGGQCLNWTARTASLQSFLGSPGRTLFNGTTSWDQNAFAAAEAWNGLGADFRFSVTTGGPFTDPCSPQGGNNVCASPDGQNPIYFASSRCGAGFGDAIELTLACWIDQTGSLLNAAVLVNNNVPWNAYDGPLRISGGRYVYDIRRVLMHELGHVLGLDHPDEYGQSVPAIMNSRVSDLDRLQADDINGIFSIYGGGAPVTSDEGSSTGCHVSARSVPGTAWPWLLPLGAVALRRFRRRA